MFTPSQQWAGGVKSFTGLGCDSEFTKPIRFVKLGPKMGAGGARPQASGHHQRPGPVQQLLLPLQGVDSESAEPEVSGGAKGPKRVPRAGFACGFSTCASIPFSFSREPFKRTRICLGKREIWRHPVTAGIWSKSDAQGHNVELVETFKPGNPL